MSEAELVLPEIPPASIAKMIERMVSNQTSLILAVKAQDAPTAQWLVDQGHALKQLEKAIAVETAPATELRRIATKISERYTESKRMIAAALAHCRSEPIRFKREAEAAVQRALQAAAETGATQQEIARTAATLAPAPVGISEVERWTWERVEGEEPDPEVMIPDAQRLNREVQALRGSFKRRGFRAVRVNAGRLGK